MAVFYNPVNCSILILVKPKQQVQGAFLFNSDGGFNNRPDRILLIKARIVDRNQLMLMGFFALILCMNNSFSLINRFLVILHPCKVNHTISEYTQIQIRICREGNNYFETFPAPNKTNWYPD
jgi:hypothetical protein